MTRTLDVDYLVVGAGATGIAFTDSLVDHSRARVAVVDSRHAVGGHWLEAYPFVRLHQASPFYGVASEVLGGELQSTGPEAGLQARAAQPQIVDYYQRARDRLVERADVEILTSTRYLGGRSLVSLVSGETFEVPTGCRIVDAHYLAPRIPAEVPPPFEVAADAAVVPVNALARLDRAPRRFVVVGSGKTATDACIWLLARGVDPDAICWVRPRDPWMLDRAVMQPDAAVFTGMAADVMQAASVADSLDDLFLRLEAAGVMLRIDPGVRPTMAKSPTLARWELDELRSIQDVVRRGHLRRVERGRLTFDDGAVEIGDDALVVHCAGDGLPNRPRVPIWRPDAVTLQPVRSGFPCFGAALVGYVEATRHDDDEKNRLCPPNSYGNTLADWARMNLLGTRATQTFSAQPDIREWANGVALNPARSGPPGESPAVDEARARLVEHTPSALARLAELVGTA